MTGYTGDLSVYVRDTSEYLCHGDTIPLKYAGNETWKSCEIPAQVSDLTYVIIKQWVQPSFGHGDFHVFIECTNGENQLEIYQGWLSSSIPHLRMAERNPKFCITNPLTDRSNIDYGHSANDLLNMFFFREEMERDKRMEKHNPCSETNSAKQIGQSSV